MATVRSLRPVGRLWRVAARSAGPSGEFTKGALVLVILGFFAFPTMR